MQKLIKILLIIIFMFTVFSTLKVEANTIQKISMDIFIEENGDARVLETWECNVSQGTEVYHPYYNLGNSQIKNLSVIDGNNNYTTLTKWNTTGSLADKAYKCGINKISDGVELCWGISKYGTHMYKASYTITNFVSELTDSQMIYWTLIPHNFSTTIGQVNIKIHTNFNISNTTDVWGYGNYGGTAYVYNGYIEMQSDGKLDTNEYMTILVKFPNGTFRTSNILNNDFNYYYKKAEGGSNQYQSEMKKTEWLILIILIFEFSIIILIKKGADKIRNKLLSSKKDSIDFEKKERRIPRDVPYFRDIPCKGNVFRAYYIAYQYGLIKNKTDVLGAIILKWFKDGIIKIEKKEGLFSKADAVISLKETKTENFKTEMERELFVMLKIASIDGYLEKKEFKNWCANYYTTIIYWFKDILRIEREKLIKEGLIIKEEKYMIKKYFSTPDLKQEALELAGLKKYLKEYTLIKDRDAIEVKLFEEYLIYAQIMGISKKVAKKFKDLYPEIIEQSTFNSYDNILFINKCSTRGINNAYSAKSRAGSYSSGGGGYSSGGGGGGSFGGGGGGGGGFR